MLRIRPRHLALAALGGALGTAARFAMVEAAPSWKTLSAGTVAVNVLGPFFLGLLLQWLSDGVDTRRERALRLLVGVGFLGALTSYAQLTLDTIVLLSNDQVLLALTYAVATIVAGAAAVWCGIFAATRWRARLNAGGVSAR